MAQRPIRFAVDFSVGFGGGNNLFTPAGPHVSHRVASGMHTFVARAISGARGEFGAIKLERKHDNAFRNALCGPEEPGLHVEILLDAQAAIFEGNVRRAVLELAIACEVFAKHTFLGADGSAAQIVEALEDRGKA